MWPNITHYCKFWERHPRLEITCQYNIGKLIWLHKWKKKKGTKKIFTTGVVKSRGDRAEENSEVTPSHTKSHPPHSSCCSTLVLLRSHKRLDFTCIHNYLNQSAVVFVCYSFSSSSEAKNCDYHSPLLLVFWLKMFVCLLGYIYRN